MRNAFIPTLTVIALQFGYLLGGAIITETIFAWPGIGRWLFLAVMARDFRAVQGGVLLIATLFIVVNLVADVLDRPHPKWRIPFFPVYAAAVVCEAICRPLGISPPLYPRRVEFFQFDRAFNIDKAKKLLDYHPATLLKEGLRATAEWYRENGLL